MFATIGVLCFSCNNSVKSSNMEITNQTIIGTWIGHNREYIDCLNSDGKKSMGLSTIECKYQIFQDSMSIKRNKILSSNCDSISPDSLLDSTLSGHVLKSLWKLVNDTLFVSDSIEVFSGNQTDTTMKVDFTIKLTPYGFNKIIFNILGISDTCQKQ